MFQLYDKLLQFPLFQGLGYTDLKQIVAHTKFDFKKFASGETIVCDGDNCKHLYMLTDGTFEISATASANRYTVKETSKAPAMFQIEHLFGLHQQFSCHYKALSACSLIIIDKNELMWLAETFMVFRMNLLNILTTQVQKTEKRIWSQAPDNTEGLIIQFLVDRCRIPTGPKQFFILMNQLAKELNDSRLNISNALNHLQQLDYIKLHRGRIEIPEIATLQKSFHASSD